MGKKRIHVMDTSFRDGFQSVFGGRVLTADFIPAVEAAVAAGIRHFEMGGGARFQSLYFYCNEDAFDMMDTFRATVGPDIKLQTLARGISYVGLDSGSRDVLDLHAKLFKKHGVTTIRNFDALNDVQNLEYSAECITRHGLNHEVCVTMMELPPGCGGAHEVDFYETVLRRIMDAGIPFDSVCFKDASGTSRPRKVYEAIAMGRRLLGRDAHIRFHTHETAGVSIACYLAALDAGVDGIDLAMEPVSGGTSQPDILTMMHALKGSDYDLGFDLMKILEAEKVLKECLKDYFMPPEAKEVSALIPFSPMPGGALTANTQMMRDNKCLDKFPLVIDEMNEVVKRGGFGTSVTPVSQFYFQQAFNNVIFGPWKKIADGYGKMVLGYFGKTPVAPDPDIVKIAAEQLGMEPTTENPLDIADRDYGKGLDHARQVLAENGIEESEENLFIVASCAEKGVMFLKGAAVQNVRKLTHEEPTKTHAQKHDEEVESQFDKYVVEKGGQAYDVLFADSAAAEAYQQIWDDAGLGWKLEAAAKRKGGAGEEIVAEEGKAHIHAPLPSNVFKVLVKPGDKVVDGDVVMILEAMKMIVEVQAPADGEVDKVHVTAGKPVESGQVLITLSVE